MSNHGALSFATENTIAIAIASASRTVQDLTSSDGTKLSNIIQSNFKKGCKGDKAV